MDYTNKHLFIKIIFFLQINGKLQDNYNSVDFVEVEQVDDEKSSRQLGDDIIKLRQNLVDGVEGNMTKVKVLFHYDNMRFVIVVK